MKIGGPFLDPQRRKSKKRWYLSYFVPKRKPDGTPELNDKGRAVLERKRPYYETKDLAQEDKPRILAQYASSGMASTGGVLGREAVAEYEAAKAIVPEVGLPDLARFWRLHHPLEATAAIDQLVQPYLDDVEARLTRDEKRRLSREHHRRDLKARVGAFCRHFHGRLPQTLTRAEILGYLKGLKDPPHKLSGRTIWNHAGGITNFLNWLVDQGHLEANPIANLRRRHLPKFTSKEIVYFRLPEVERYLRTMERYDPELVAHEVIQLFAGVRADGEMADFRGEWVLPETREVVIPAEIAKTEKREVIGDAAPLEENFWSWWQAYGRTGLLRPRSYAKRWERIRYLMTIDDEAERDRIAALRLEDIQRMPDRRQRLRAWPYNARRRTFCSYHVAKHQGAQKTALILRHRGSVYTLHNSYRGTGISPSQGEAYFALRPHPVAAPQLFARDPRRLVA